MYGYIASEGDAISLIIELPRQGLKEVETAINKNKFIDFRIRGTLRLRASSEGNLEVSGSVDASIKR